MIEKEALRTVITLAKHLRPDTTVKWWHRLIPGCTARFRLAAIIRFLEQLDTAG